ncbi:electron transfer flavoprotein alpha/beta subunit [Sinorhizobium meliloti]
MHLVVYIKQVPDPAQIGIDPVTNTIMHQGVPTAITPTPRGAFIAPSPAARAASRRAS